MNAPKTSASPKTGRGTGLRERAATSREEAERLFQERLAEDKARPAVYVFNARALAEMVNLEPFDVPQLCWLYEVTGILDETTSALSERGACVRERGPGWHSPSALGLWVDFESERIGFLQERCIKELRRRLHGASDDERSRIMESLMRHEVRRVGTIQDPELKAELLKQWGAR